MIIKVATGKDENNKIQWMPLYAAAIRNRLRRDNNLSDVTDIVAARENLGIDSNFLSVFNTFRNDITQYINEQIMKEGEDVATVLAQISDILTALTLRLSSWENALTANWGNGDVDLDNYLYYVGEMANFPETPKVGWTVCIDGIIYLYTGSAWVQLTGNVISGGGSGTVEGGGGSGTIYPPTVKYDNYSIPKVSETFPVLVDADQCRYRLIFPLEAAPTTEQGLMISPYNPREANTHYVKGRFAMHGSNAVLYLPKVFAIQNNDRAMAQSIFPPEGITGNPIDISNDLIFEYDAMPPSSQYIVIRLTSSVLNSIKDTWSMANLTGIRLVLDYSYAQGLTPGSDVTIKTYRFIPESNNPSSNETTILPRTDMWKMWMTDDELRLSEPSTSYNSTLSYTLNGQYPIEWQEAATFNAQYADPAYSYNLLDEPVVRLSDISTVNAIYRSFSNAAYANLAIASWNTTTKKQDGDDIKPLDITSLPPFQEPVSWLTISQGIDPIVDDDETLVSLEFEIFAHKQTNKVFAVQDNLNLSVDYSQLYQWGTNSNSNYLSLYLPSDFMTKRGTNRDITFELLDDFDDDYFPSVFLLPSEYGKMYINWSLYNATFPGVSESLRNVPYVQLSYYQNVNIWEPFTYVMKKTNDGEQFVISIDKNLINTYVNDLPYDITDLSFDSSGKYKYTDTGGYGTHQTNKRLLLQWKVKRKNPDQPYYYEKYMWQHEDKNLSKKISCFDIIAKQGNETTRYNKILTPITEHNKLDDGTAGYGQIIVSDGDILWKYSDSSNIRVVTNGDTTDTTTGIRTLSHVPVNNITSFYYDPENLYVRLTYNKLLEHFGSSYTPEISPLPPPPPPPPPPFTLGYDKEFDDGFPDLLDICKYTIPARNYKFIFELEPYHKYLNNYGYNAYRILHTKPFSGSNNSQADGTERYWTARKHQPSGRFMYNYGINNLDSTSPPAVGASLFLPESFFDESLYDKMYIAIRAPEGVAKTSVKLYGSSSSSTTNFVWLRNSDVEDDKSGDYADATVYKIRNKHALTWSSTCTYQAVKSTEAFMKKSPYSGYRVIHVPQETLNRITGGWNYNTSKKNLCNLQLMISYTLKSSVFNDLNLPTDQMRKVNTRQIVVRNLYGEGFKKMSPGSRNESNGKNSIYTNKVGNINHPVNVALEAYKMKHFVFEVPSLAVTGVYNLITEWSRSRYTNFEGYPIVHFPLDIQRCTIILQNRYIAGGNWGVYSSDDNRRQFTAWVGNSDMAKVVPGQYYEISQLSTVNKFVFNSDTPTPTGYSSTINHNNNSHVWNVPNMKYQNGCDVDAFYIDAGTLGKRHNTALIIYEEP